MLTGGKKLIGRGYIRDVYLVDWGGRKLVVKFLREDYEERTSEARVEKIHRWEAAALHAVSDKIPRFSSMYVPTPPETDFVSEARVDLDFPFDRLYPSWGCSGVRPRNLVVHVCTYRTAQQELAAPLYQTTCSHTPCDIIMSGSRTPERSRSARGLRRIVSVRLLLHPPGRVGSEPGGETFAHVLCGEVLQLLCLRLNIVL